MIINYLIALSVDLSVLLFERVTVQSQFLDFLLQRVDYLHLPLPAVLSCHLSATDRTMRGSSKTQNMILYSEFS